MKRIDLNCDLGESYGRFKVGNDEAIMPYITSCNIACGFHGGDPVTIVKTIDLAASHGVQIGAHPSFPDLQGFGRREMVMSNEELSACVKYQVMALKGLTEAVGQKLRHVKPHGALYNAAAKDLAIAKTLISTVFSLDPELVFVGPAMNAMRGFARDLGQKYASEVFADRRYNDNLTLVSRALPEAMITDEEEAERQVLQMALDQKVTTVTGVEKDITAETICLHGDQPNAVNFARRIRTALIEQGLTIKAHADD
ncbi:MAG: 5-oxoprolinase subunit PxpA [Cyclobacteriaceae bacterium]